MWVVRSTRMSENLNQQKFCFFLQASPRVPAPCHDHNNGASDDDDDDDCDDDCLQELPSPLSLPRSHAAGFFHFCNLVCWLQLLVGLFVYLFAHWKQLLIC